MKVQTVLIVAAILAVGLFFASRAQSTDNPTLTDTLDRNGVSYMTLFDRSPSTLVVFGDTDVKQMCELADNYPNVGVEEVYNVTQNTTAKCGIVQTDFNSI